MRPAGVLGRGEGGGAVGGQAAFVPAIPVWSVEDEGPQAEPIPIKIKARKIFFIIFSCLYILFPG
jgi:hypothetical protein